VYGVLRHGRQLDFTLGQFAKLHKTDVRTTIALRMGAYELLHMRTADHAAVHEAVNLSEGKQRQSFVNAVLRRIARERETLPSPEDQLESRDAALAVSTSMPDWLLAELRATHLHDFDELEAWARAHQLRPALAIRVNPLVADVETVEAEMSAAGIVAERVGDVPGALLLPSGGGAVPQLPGTPTFGRPKPCAPAGPPPRPPRPLLSPSPPRLRPRRPSLSLTAGRPIYPLVR